MSVGSTDVGHGSDEVADGKIMDVCLVGAGCMPPGPSNVPLPTYVVGASKGVENAVVVSVFAALVDVMSVVECAASDVVVLANGVLTSSGSP